MKKENGIVNYKASELPPVSAEDLARLRATRDEDIDFSDIPEITEEQWKTALMTLPTGSDALQIKPEIYQWFKQFGDKKNMHINAALSSYIAQHSPDL